MVRQLNVKEAEKLLTKYDIPFPKSQLAKTKKDAVSLAKKIGYPVVLKVSSEEIIHKSYVGGVKINIKNQDELEKAYDDIMRGCKGKKVDGILVQEMVEGIYVLIGMKRDAAFGPVIAFGLGGIFVEILEDVAFRVAPINKDEAMSMVKSIKSFPILAGARGGEKINLDLLASLLVNASKLAMSEPKLNEFDLNPVVINSKHARAVDARFLE
ncbi:MAG: acetate--CoA ligase family protein [Candidatus Woesearchaeota archaeon]